ncbi:membrane protein of unknown function [Bradyrhizobium sp. ORS 285]|uniref:hypothetical protein n=1 Tax=Bradyrhizobium sp. ORS 285 TaxID=115808 RepID=UPI000240959B|nr:hypothetical protein [Bradyrhizobium sp. ORS 285]CCD89855.1 membrane hypothetical protein [Bradyrhizobium sp. ORS 285]SMX61517.1 membrane protein of unknown function [Bradyrhizobium sp. ORS 285]
MDEQNLQINITAVDQASGALDNVAESAESMSMAVGKAADGMAENLDTVFADVEAAAAKTAEAAANSWIAAVDDITTSAGEAASSIEADYDAIAGASGAAAGASTMSWDESLANLDLMMNGTEEQAAAAFAAMGGKAEESAAKATNAMAGMHGYFRMLIAGYMAETAGKSLMSWVDDAVKAAAGDPTKLADLTNQLREQQAELLKLEQPISGKGKTTGELWADEAEQAAKIDAVKQKISELKDQIEPLAFAHEHAGKAADQYDAATKRLTEDWQHFLVTAGIPLLEHATAFAQAVDHVVTVLTAWTAEHPKLTEAIALTATILGSLLLVLGAVFIAIAPLIIIVGMFGAGFTLASAGIAVAIAAIIAGVAALVATIIVNWDSITARTREVWSAIAAFIKDDWQAIVQFLLPGVGALVIALAAHWDTIKHDIGGAWQWILDFTTQLWGKITSAVTGAISGIESAIDGFVGSMQKALSAVSSLPGAVAGSAAGLIPNVPKFAEGGIVSSPTLALVGEAGPEAIIPLSSFGGAGLAGAGGGAGGGNIVINLSGNFYGSDSSMMRRLAQDLAGMINSQIKLRAF